MLGLEVWIYDIRSFVLFTTDRCIAYDDDSLLCIVYDALTISSCWFLVWFGFYAYYLGWLICYLRIASVSFSLDFGTHLATYIAFALHMVYLHIH